MTPAEFTTFGRLWIAAWEVYGKAPTAAGIELAFNALCRYELEEVRRALSTHVQDPDVGQYPPKPADIVRLLDGRRTDVAALAWTKVERAIRTVGAYQSVAFDDPVIHAVIADLGGWVRLCETTLERLPFLANEFQKRYRAYTERPPLSWPRYLIGIAEASNVSGGFASRREDPALIGDRSGARQLLELEDGEASLVTRLLERLPARAGGQP